MPKRQLKGIVVSNKMLKTLVVKVERIKEHGKYKRRYKVHKNYKAHNDGINCLIGDVVVIEETTPISKDKKWKVVKKLTDLKEIAEETTEESEIIPASIESDSINGEAKEEKVNEEVKEEELTVDENINIEKEINE